MFTTSRASTHESCAGATVRGRRAVAVGIQVRCSSVVGTYGVRVMGARAGSDAGAGVDAVGGRRVGAPVAVCFHRLWLGGWVVGGSCGAVLVWAQWNLQLTHWRFAHTPPERPYNC